MFNEQNMYPTNIPVIIGVEQSDGNGSEQIGAFVTNTSEYLAACDRARERTAELNAEYPEKSIWYAYISDEHGHKEIF
jgi:hypothetical protein